VFTTEPKAAPDHTLDAENPWPGLMPFTEAAQAFFHGRDAEAAELLRQVRRERLTILFGQSGLGKTSLLCAGLFRDCAPPIFCRLHTPRLDDRADFPGRADQAGARREPGGARRRGPRARLGRNALGVFP
jgi:Novel STAND NTPase 1